MIKQDKFWNSHYKKKRTPKISSKFAKFIFKNFLKKEGHEFSLFDVGCGNGRDIFFFLQKGINCIGIDKSQIAISKNKDKNKKYNKNFINTDFSLFLFDEHTKKKLTYISNTLSFFASSLEWHIRTWTNSFGNFFKYEDKKKDVQ